jgi:hypothetical protein
MQAYQCDKCKCLFAETREKVGDVTINRGRVWTHVTFYGKGLKLVFDVKAHVCTGCLKEILDALEKFGKELECLGK